MDEGEPSCVTRERFKGFAHWWMAIYSVGQNMATFREAGRWQW
jgi:hypothetical protein